MQLKIGMKFKAVHGEHEITIVNILPSVLGDRVDVASKTGAVVGIPDYWLFPNEGLYTLIEKPLDQAFKELDIQLCKHRNIREDRYFSAMVYKTCKDCGKPLN